MGLLSNSKLSPADIGLSIKSTWVLKGWSPLLLYPINLLENHCQPLFQHYNLFKFLYSSSSIFNKHICNFFFFSFQKNSNSFSYSHPSLQTRFLCLSQLEMANSQRDTLSAGNARFNRMPSNMSASNGECPRPRQPMAPSAPPVQRSQPTWAANTWAANPFPGRAYHQLPTPNANFAQSASSPSHVQGARRPNTNRPTYALPPPIDLWDCCNCGHTNLPANCPEMCGDCPHKRCSQCHPTSDVHMPSTVGRRAFEPDESLSRHHSWSEAVTKMLVIYIRGRRGVFRIGCFPPPRSTSIVSTAGYLGIGSAPWGEKDVG